MGDSLNGHKNSKHDNEPSCSLYVSRAINSHSHSALDDLSKSTLTEAICASGPSGHWNVCQTPRGLIATFALEADVEKLLQSGDISCIFQSPVQVTRFSTRDSRYRQSVFLRDVPCVIPLEDLNSALTKQGIPAETIERWRQYVRVEVLDASHYEILLSQGLDFFGAARFTALPEPASWWHEGPELSPGQRQPALLPRFSTTEGSNAHQQEGVLQCYRCQGFWHIAANCRHLPRCVRCGEQHSVDFCPRPRNSPICCHCSGPHHAAYRQCPVRLQLLNATPISLTLSTKSNGHIQTQNPTVNQRQL